MADYEAYAASQAEVDKAYRDQPRWQKMAIHITARVGKFSSDRTILEYAEKVWKLPQVGV
jgi:starch phosphorylase